MKSNWFREMFEDQAGSIDEKRVVGIPTFVLGILFALAVGAVFLVTVLKGHVDTAIIGPGLSVAAFLTGAGATALGGAVLGDQGKLATPSQQ